MTSCIKKPPAALPSLAFGRANEAKAVEQYKLLYPALDVQECGLFVHPEQPFLAASPDRVVIYTLTGDRGLPRGTVSKQY